MMKVFKLYSPSAKEFDKMIAHHLDNVIVDDLKMEEAMKGMQFPVSLNNPLPNNSTSSFWKFGFWFLATSLTAIIVAYFYTNSVAVKPTATDKPLQTLPAIADKNLMKKDSLLDEQKTIPYIPSREVPKSPETNKAVKNIYKNDIKVTPITIEDNKTPVMVIENNKIKKDNSTNLNKSSTIIKEDSIIKNPIKLNNKIDTAVSIIWN